MMNIPKIDDVIKLVEEKLKEENLTQRKYADKIGMHQPTLHRILKKKNLPSIESFQKIISGLKKRSN